MQIINDKALLVRTKSPEKYSIIPKSKHLKSLGNGVHEVLINWGVDEARVLKNLGVKNVPSPIERHYDWPGRHKPFKHQIETASFLTLHRRAFVFSEPGTGKTLSALWAADYLMRKGYVRRCLIICPLSIMHSAWMGDIGKSVIHRSAAVAHHTKVEKRKEVIYNDYEFVITNYEGLNMLWQDILDDDRFDLIIVDEANAYKNPSTTRWKSLNKIVTARTTLWMMTGTPAAQSPVDAYGLAKLVNPTGVPKFMTAWKELVMRKVTMYKWVAKPDAKDKVFDALQPAIRFTKAECLDLPPVITLTRDVPLTAQQNKYYKMLKEQLLINASGETITAVNAAAAINKLLQISAGAAYTDKSEVVDFDCSPRLNVLLEVLEETDRKVLVFAPFRHSIEVIHEFLTKQGIASDVIHGNITANNRHRIFTQFQKEDNPRILVIQPQAASHGVTLTAADTVVFWGPVMSVDTYIQCCARTDRVGQDSDKVTVVHLQGSDVERRMFKQLERRVQDHSEVVKLYEEILAS
jgi:SNF2 family DNA or RNA helicase